MSDGIKLGTSDGVSDGAKFGILLGILEPTILGVSDMYDWTKLECQMVQKLGCLTEYLTIRTWDIAWNI